MSGNYYCSCIRVQQGMAAPRTVALRDAHYTSECLNDSEQFWCEFVRQSHRTFYYRDSIRSTLNIDNVGDVDVHDVN